MTLTSRPDQVSSPQFESATANGAPAFYADASVETGCDHKTDEEVHREAVSPSTALMIARQFIASFFRRGDELVLDFSDLATQRSALSREARSTDPPVLPVTPGLEELLAGMMGIEAGENYLILDGARYNWVMYRDDERHADDEHEALTAAVLAGRERAYIARGVWRDAPDVRDTLRGSNVEIIALVSEETGLPVASLRLVHGLLDDLPTIQKMIEKGALTQEGIDFLHERMRGGREVVEIAALWKNADIGREVVLALYQFMVRVTTRRGALCILGSVPAEIAGLTSIFGEEALHSLGNRFEVDDGLAAKKLRLTPTAIDMRTWPDELRDGIEAMGDAEETALLRDFRSAMMWYLL